MTDPQSFRYQTDGLVAEVCGTVGNLALRYSKRCTPVYDCSCSVWSCCIGKNKNRYSFCGLPVALVPTFNPYDSDRFICNRIGESHSPLFVYTSSKGPRNLLSLSYRQDIYTSAHKRGNVQGQRPPKNYSRNIRSVALRLQWPADTMC